MTHKIKDTLLLLFFFLFLLGIVLIDRYGDLKEEKSSKRVGALLFSYNPLKINYFSFAKGNLFFECILQNDRWIIKHPFFARANRDKIEELIATIFSLRCIDVITLSHQKMRGISPAHYGFSSLSPKITVADDVKKYTIHIGALSLTKNTLYLMLENNDDIFVVNTNILGILPETLEALRDNRLITGNPDMVGKMEIKKLNSSPVVIAKYDNEWIITKPFFARADWFKIKTMIEQLFKTRIISFVSDSPSTEAIYGLNDDEYLLKISLFYSEEEPVSVIFGRTSNRFPDAIYAKRSDEQSVVLVNASFVKEISEGLNSIVDSRLFFLPPNKINYISLSDNKITLTLQLCKTNGAQEWFLADPAYVKADNEAVKKLIDQLNNLKIMRFEEQTNYMAFSGGKVAFKISVGTDDLIKEIARAISVKEKDISATNRPALPKTVRTLKIISSTQDNAVVSAMFEGENVIYSLSLSALSSLQITPTFYQDKTVLSFKPDQVKKIIIRKNQEEYIFFKREDAKWQQEKPIEHKINIQYLEDLIRMLAGLKAIRFEQLEGKNLSIFGLSEPVITLTLIFDVDAEIFQKTILIGGTSDDLLYYAMIKGQNILFLINNKVVETVSLLIP